MLFFLVVKCVMAITCHLILASSETRKNFSKSVLEIMSCWGLVIDVDKRAGIEIGENICLESTSTIEQRMRDLKTE